MFCMNIMADQDFVTLFVFYKLLNHVNSKSIIWKITPWNQLVVGVFRSKEVKLNVTLEFISKIE